MTNGMCKADANYLKLSIDAATEMSGAKEYLWKDTLAPMLADISLNRMITDENTPWKHKGLIFSLKALGSGIYAAEDLHSVLMLIARITSGTGNTLSQIRDNVTLFSYLMRRPVAVPKNYRPLKHDPLGSPRRESVFMVPLGRHCKNAITKIPYVVLWAGTALDYAPACEITEDLLADYGSPADAEVRRDAAQLLRKMLRQLEYVRDTKALELINLQI